MSIISQRGATAPFGLFQNDTTPSNVTYPGQKFDLADGREVTLVSVGASDIAAGLLVQSSAQVADHENLTVTAFTPASVQFGTPATVVATLGATAATANQYAGGFLVVNDGTGVGQTLRISANTAALGGASVTIQLEDAPVVDLDNTSVVSLLANLYSNVIVNPASATGTPVGVTLYASNAGEYVYIVSKGIVSCLADGVVPVGSAISSSNAVAGAYEAGVIAQGFVGRAIELSVDTKNAAIFVDL